MKKLLALLLVLCLIFAFTACGGSNSDNKGDSSKSNTATNTGNGNDKITFNEFVAIDNDECKITITGIDPDNMWGYTLKAQLENKSAEKTYMFSLDTAALNGVTCSSLFASDVAPGKKSNEDIVLLDDELIENNVGAYTDIELTFRVYDSEDWTADDVAKETVHIYPFGEDKADKFTRKAQDSDTVIVDNEYVTAIVTGYYNDDIWGYTAKLFLVNKTDTKVMFSADDVSVNGFMIDPFFATSVAPGNCAFAKISWSDSSLEENSITEIEKIEFTFSASDYDDWMADDIVNKAVTLKP